MKAGLYCRVSTDEQDVTKQERTLKEYCERNNIEVYKVYSDSGISGMKSSRPAFDEMLSDLRLYRFNVLIVSKLDRVGRSLQHLLSIFEEFRKKGVHFISTTQNIDTTSPAGMFQLQVLGAFAEFERNIISERTKEGMKYAKNVGKRGKDKKQRKKRGVLRKAQNTLKLIQT